MRISGVLTGKVFLEKKGEIVGEAIILSEDNVNYHLWESLRLTRTCTLKELKRKFKLRRDKN